MNVTFGESSEWSRCAVHMYAAGRGPDGHALSAAATKKTLTIADFDRISLIYRVWLTSKCACPMCEVQS